MVRLKYLNGLRGFCALYVVLSHANFRFLTLGQLNAFTYPLSRVLGYGHSAVTIFILISGFSLGLQVENNKPFHTLSFLKRRYWRIAPPMYAVMLFAILLACLRFHAMGIDWHPEPRQILCDLLLLNDVYPDVELVTLPLWTVALEAKIYCLFPILVWLYRQQGTVAVIVFASLVSAIACIIAHHTGKQNLSLWYIGLFALGFLASQQALWQPQRLAIGSGALLLLLFFYFPIWGDWFNPSHYHNHLWETDLALGLFTACLFQCQLLARTTALPDRFFSLPALTHLGGFSYSLYLVHEPVQACLNALTLDESGQLSRFVLFVIAVSLSVLVAQGFYWAVERHFVNYPTLIARQ